MLIQRPNRNIYYGWYIAAALACSEVISWGIVYYAFTVFLVPMEHELGWTRAQLTSGFSLFQLVMGATGFLVGSWIDQRGGRLLMTLGSILASLLLVAWSQVHDLTAFYWIWAALGVCGALILYEPAFTIMAMWFNRRRTTALAIITFAGGLASTIFVPLSDALLQRYGWRGATLILGLFLAITTIPLHALILRRRPSDLGLHPDGEANAIQTTHRKDDFSVKQALSNRTFWTLTLAFGFAYLSSNALRVHIIPLLVAAGVDPSTAAYASGAIGLMQVAGRLIYAPTSSRIPKRLIVAGLFAMEGLAVLLLFGTPPAPAIILFVVLYGSAYGAQTLARASILAEQFNPAHFGRISSLMMIFLTLVNTAAPVGASLIYDRVGNYQPVLFVAIILALVGAGIMAFVNSSQADAI